MSANLFWPFVMAAVFTVAGLLSLRGWFPGYPMARAVFRSAERQRRRGTAALFFAVAAFTVGYALYSDLVR